MPFDWTDFLNLAKYLNGHESSQYKKESALRTSASRAYYAAFCQARRYAKKNLGYHPPYSHNDGDHIKLYHFFKEKGMQQFADSLRRLKNWRNQCDYDDDVDDLHGLVKGAIAKSEFILSKTSKTK